MKVRAGAALRDVTPPAGLLMAGFGARTEPATGAHDPLTVRALVIDGTAILVADVIGIEADMSARIRARCALADAQVVIAATHTHGGPSSMRRRIRAPHDARWLDTFEAACVAVLDDALAASRPATLHFAAGRDPGLARNRRIPDGPVDRVLPCLSVRGDDGAWIAVLASWACHPVVLGADNRRWTADYVQYLRAGVQVAFPGAIVIAATGCCGDVNHGHSAQASMSLAATDLRSFAQAGRLGTVIAGAMLNAESAPVAETGIACADEVRALPLQMCDSADIAAAAARWREALDGAHPVRAAILRIWLDWAEATACQTPDAAINAVPARVSAMRWGDVTLVAMPGEIYAQTALGLRETLGDRAFILSYAEDNPGYINPTSAFAAGGYEVEEAHRYYGMPAAFAPGAAETLEAAARRALARLAPRP